MPSPSSTLQRPDLGATFEQFNLEMDRRGFIGGRAAPVIEVAQSSANIGRVPLAALLHNADTARAPGSNYAQSNFKFDSFSYATEEHGFEEPVDRRLARIYKRYLDLEVIATARAQDVVLRNLEKRVAALLFNPTTFASYTGAVSNEWDKPAAATPVDDVKTAIEAVFTQSGLRANALIISEKVLNNLRVCEQVLDRIVYSGFRDPTLPRGMVLQYLADLFNLDFVLSGGGAKNTANQGQTAVPGRIWDDEYAMIARVAVTPDPREACVARTFHWGEDGSQIGTLVESYYSDEKRADVIRARMDTDEVVMYAAAAYLLSNITQ